MNLEYLRHGKALCGKVFRRFVETFNFHNDFIANLKGDADLQVVGGKVNVDRTDERHPVIRCQGCGGGGGGGGGGGDVDNGCWAIGSVVVNDYGAINVTFRNGFFVIGGITYECPIDGVTAYEGWIVALLISVDGELPTPHIECFSSLTAMNREASDPDGEIGYASYCVPLYQFGSGGSVMVDFRNAPLAAAWRFQG